jgi:hypothetical protein
MIKMFQNLRDECNLLDKSNIRHMNKAPIPVKNSHLSSSPPWLETHNPFKCKYRAERPSPTLLLLLGFYCFVLIWVLEAASDFNFLSSLLSAQEASWVGSVGLDTQRGLACRAFSVKPPCLLLGKTQKCFESSEFGERVCPVYVPGSRDLLQSSKATQIKNTTLC